MVTRDFSSLAVGAERNLDASHISLPVTAPQNLPEPQHQDDNPSPACTVGLKTVMKQRRAAEEP